MDMDCPGYDEKGHQGYQALPKQEENAIAGEVIQTLSLDFILPILPTV